MPQDKSFTSIGATTTTNVMSGRLFERVGGRPAQIKVYACALTGNAGDLEATLVVGSDVICQNAGLRPLATGPLVPDDQIASGVALPGDPISLQVTNSTAGAIVCGWTIDVTYA